MELQASKGFDIRLQTDYIATWLGANSAVQALWPQLTANQAPIGSFRVALVFLVRIPTD